MPRGRKPKVDLLLAPKEETKKVKSPWDKTKGETPEVPLEEGLPEFSQAVIEKNREVSKKVQIASIPTNGGFSNKQQYTVTVNRLVDLIRGHGTGLNSVYAETGSQDTVHLYYYRDETDEEVISRLRQKKLELEKLREELSDEAY